MQLDIDLIFPIRDAASAELMTLKAACLWNAGVIDARQKKMVELRARKLLENDKVMQAASAAYAIKTTRPDAGFILGKRRAHGATPRADSGRIHL
jgi:hypothetical protein